MSVNVYHAANDSLEPFVGGTFYAECPIASILPYGGSEPPDGWLLCQGQEVAKIKYPDLYNVIGDSFGTASDNAKFVLPDMRESVPKGAGLTSKSSNHMDADGLAVGEFIDDRLQTHTHEVQSISDSWSGTQGSSERYLFKTTDLATTDNTGRTGATTEVKSVGVNYIIKATTISLPSDFEAAVDEKIQDIYNVMGQNGAKNLLLVKAETGLSDGITYTVNADKSITLNGTATATVYVTVNTSFTLNETCIVTGTPKNLPDSVFMYIQNQSHTFIDHGDGVEAVSGTYGCYIQIPTGTTLTSATFYPMIRLATDTDDTYVPYAMTNSELTERKKVSLSTTDFPKLYRTAYLYMRNGVVQLELNGFVNLSQGENTAVITLPQEFRPDSVRRMVATAPGTSEHYRLSLYPSGNIDVYCYSTSSSSANIAFDMIYIK